MLFTRTPVTASCLIMFVSAEEFGRGGRTPENAQLLVADRAGRRAKGQDVRGHHRGVRHLLGTTVFCHVGTAPAVRQPFRLRGDLRTVFLHVRNLILLPPKISFIGC